MIVKNMQNIAKLLTKHCILQNIVYYICLKYVSKNNTCKESSIILLQTATEKEGGAAGCYGNYQLCRAS